MTRDWWWPWWISSLIDLGVAAVAATVLWRTARRRVRIVAACFVAAGLVTCVLAPVVMREPDDENEIPMPMSTTP